MRLSKGQRRALDALAAAGRAGIRGPNLLGLASYDQLADLKAAGLIRLEVLGAFFRWFLTEHAPSSSAESDDAPGPPGSDPGRANARAGDLDTAHEAAGKVRGARAAALERVVCTTLGEYGPMTTHEVADVSGWPVVSISPRIKPLRDRGLVDFSRDAVGAKVRRAGRHVWELTGRGQEEINSR